MEMKCDSLVDGFHRGDDDPLLLNQRVSSKVTFESLMTQTSLPSSPKTKDQSVMAQIDSKGRFNYTNITQEHIQDVNEIKNGRPIVFSEGTVTSGSTSAKSSVKELVSNPKPINHRKSKSQNRARKALRTITFILGRFFSKEISFLFIFLLFFFRRFCCLLDPMVSDRSIEVDFNEDELFLGIFILPYIHCVNHVKRIGYSPIQCSIVFIFFAISIHRLIHFAMH